MLVSAPQLPSRSSQTGVATGSYSTVVARGTVPAGSGAGGQHRGPGSAGSSGGVGATGGGAGGDGDVDVLLVGPAGMPRDLSVAVAAVEKVSCIYPLGSRPLLQLPYMHIPLWP